MFQQTGDKTSLTEAQITAACVRHAILPSLLIIPIFRLHLLQQIPPFLRYSPPFPLICLSLLSILHLNSCGSAGVTCKLLDTWLEREME